MFRFLNVNTIIEGGKKQNDLFFGSKEQKQTVIKTYLAEAQSRGVDVKNVVVSKGIFDKVLNSFKLSGNFYVGFTKCFAIPENAASLAAEKITAKASEKLSGFKVFSDIIACYFEAFDETASSLPGVQHMLDAGIVDTSELLGNVE